MMQHTSVWYRRSVSPFVLVASVAVFLTATANLTFFDKISQTYPIADDRCRALWRDATDHHAVIIVSLCAKACVDFAINHGRGDQLFY